MMALRACEIALRAKAKPILMDDASAVRGGDLLCAVGAAGIDDELFIRKRDAVETAPDYRSLVASDHEQRDGKFLRRRHGRKFHTTVAAKERAALAARDKKTSPIRI